MQDTPADSIPESDSLLDALKRHNLQLPPATITSLDAYRELLWAWNERLNLTRHTNFEKFVSRDVVDAKVLADLLEPGEDVLDVGTGGGVPGIIIAMLRADVSVSLSESVEKKARAVQSIVDELEINVPVHHARAELLLDDDHSYDTLVVRAVASLRKLLTWFDPHWGSFRRLLVLKGPKWVDERQEAREAGLMKHLELRRLASYPLPGTYSESVVLQIRPRQQ